MTSTALPIVCTLSAAALPLRLAQMADLGRAALLDVDHDERRAQLRFARGEGVRERVQAIAAAESQCCAFLTMHVGENTEDVVLVIEAPHGAELVLADLVDAFRGGRPEAAC